MSFGKNIILAFFVIFLMTMFCCCRSKQMQQNISEAIAMVTYADSLRQEGILYKDTSKLKEIISVLESTRLSSNESMKLSLAYFLLGRNYDVLHMDTKEVPCFIKCLESGEKHTLVHGLSYVHLSDICRHQYEDSLAINLRLLANDCFRISNNTSYLFSSLVVLYEHLMQIHQYEEADDILSEISRLKANAIQNAIYEKEVALSYYIGGQDDKALNSLLHINLDSLIEYPYIENSIYLLLANIYTNKGIRDSALYFCDLIINSDSNHSIQIQKSAYDMRMYLSKEVLDSTFVNFYFSRGYEKYKQLEMNDTEESRAAMMISKYYDHIRLYRKKITHRYIIICLSIIVIIVLLYSLSKYKKSNVMNHNMNKLAIDNDLLRKKITKAQEHIFQSIQIGKKKLNEVIVSKENWKSTNIIREYVDEYLNGFWTDLERNYSLSDSEIRLCVLLVLNYSIKQAADMMCLSQSSIPTKKQRIAKKIGTTSAKLYDFLEERIKKLL